MDTLWKSIISVIVPLATASAAFGQLAPSPGSLHVQNMQYNGTGCRPGSVASNLSDDAQALTLLFDDFVIETRQGRISSKNCLVDLDINVPAGWSFAIFDVGFRGYASLDAGVRAKHNTVYRFDNNVFRDSPDLDLVGPFADDYEHYTQVPIVGRSWSRCSARAETKKLRIRTRMGLVKDPGRAARTAEGMVTVDSFDGSIVQNYSFSWQRCGGVAADDMVVPATCGANLLQRDGSLAAAFHAGSGTSYRIPANALQACERQKLAGQRCNIVRNNCR